MSDEQVRAYLQSLQPGDRVIETGQSCMTGKTGLVYISDNEGPTFGSKCVRWEDGMGTAVTWGTRRITEKHPLGEPHTTHSFGDQNENTDP